MSSHGQESELMSRKTQKANMSVYDESLPSEPQKVLPRKERTKSRESLKKMGGGKKGMWGKPEDIITVPNVDRGDPNYDSEGEENVILVSANEEVPVSEVVYRRDDFEYGPTPKLNLQEVKAAIKDILKEFFISGDTEEVSRSMVELESEVFHYELVKRSIILSMEKHEKECEMVSRLLSDLYPSVLSMEQIGKGFERLLEYVDDLELDIPSARPMLATFIARAVVDEILPPKFLMDPVVCSLGGDVVDQARKKLSQNHATARLEKGWGPGDGRPVDELKVSVDQLMQEYLLSRDLEEAGRCVRELNVEHFHHEVVKRAITNALDKDEDNCNAMSSLLAYLVTQEVVSREQLIQGLDKIKQSLDDLKLDVPSAPQIVTKFVERAIEDGILNASYKL